MATSKRHVDRRIQRTRQMLQQAFVEVVREKGFAATSIQDITERANLNRGTFYLHFADKYMMVDTFIREHFRQLLVTVFPPSSRWDKRTLRLLIQTILDYFERKYRHQHHVPQNIAPLVEHAIHEELTSFLLTLLKRSKHPRTRELVHLETMVRIVSWAIFGATIEWSQEETIVSLEQMADDILLVVMEGAARLAPDASLE